MNATHRLHVVEFIRNVAAVGTAITVSGTILGFLYGKAIVKVNAPAIAHADAAIAVEHAHTDSLYRDLGARMDRGFDRVGDILDSDAGSPTRHRLVARLKEH